MWWFKTEKTNELLSRSKDKKTITSVAKQIGVSRVTLNRIVLGLDPVGYKFLAYAIAKFMNSEYEIEDVFTEKKQN